MPVAGGLVGPNGAGDKIHGSYQKIGESAYTILQDGMHMAPEFTKGDRLPEGYCVINIEFGEQLADSGPVPVTVDDWTIVIPRGTNRAVPLEHVNALNDAVQTQYYQANLMTQLIPRHNRRFNFQVVRWPKAGGTQLKANLEDAMERHEIIDVDQN